MQKAVAVLNICSVIVHAGFIAHSATRSSD